MHTAIRTSPMIADEFLQRPVFYHQEGVKTGMDLLADATKVSAHIPACNHIINDCADRYFFTVTLLAGAIKGKINLLPSNHAKDTVGALSCRYENTLFITDNPDGPEPDNRNEDSLSILKLLQRPQPKQPSKMPDLPDDQVIAIAFTSGSTGKPQAHPRTWGWAVQEALAAGKALGLDKTQPAHIISTTPPQHMYGFVTSVFIPLALGQKCYRGRPFFPEEIREALLNSGPDSLLATTPVQIRACVLGNTEIPKIRQILSSAAPLDRTIARQAEEKYLTPVVEFYGSTETGAIASRQPTRDRVWKTFDPIRVRAVNNELEVCAHYLPDPVLLQDRVEVADEKHFQLLGRSADLIKIGGKRASLAELNHRLLMINGVEDGAFVVPDTQGYREVRLAAVVVAPGLTPQAILSALSASIDPVFLPRPLKRVDSLPRTAAGKLTRKALLAMLNRADS